MGFAMSFILATIVIFMVLIVVSKIVAKKQKEEIIEHIKNMKIKKVR